MIVIYRAISDIIIHHNMICSAPFTNQAILNNCTCLTTSLLSNKLWNLLRLSIVEKYLLSYCSWCSKYLLHRIIWETVEECRKKVKKFVILDEEDSSGRYIWTRFGDSIPHPAIFFSHKNLHWVRIVHNITRYFYLHWNRLIALYLIREYQESRLRKWIVPVSSS